ncbi:MAG: hypothetical protein EOO61_22310, partial [Hymenobacter sp.]
MPLTWNSSGKGEVMTLEGKPGKWVRGHQNNTLLTGNKQAFGENYTIEFDLIYYFQPKATGYLMPDLNFGIFSSGSKDNGDNGWLRGRRDTADLDVSFHLSNNSGVYVESNGKMVPWQDPLNARLFNEVILDAGGSDDPDSGQSLNCRWIVYPEAGT